MEKEIDRGKKEVGDYHCINMTFTWLVRLFSISVNLNVALPVCQFDAMYWSNQLGFDLIPFFSIVYARLSLHDISIRRNNIWCGIIALWLYLLNGFARLFIQWAFCSPINAASHRIHPFIHSTHNSNRYIYMVQWIQRLNRH